MICIKEVHGLDGVVGVCMLLNPMDSPIIGTNDLPHLSNDHDSVAIDIIDAPVVGGKAFPSLSETWGTLSDREKAEPQQYEPATECRVVHPCETHPQGAYVVVLHDKLSLL
jgi:hypothetical protein